MEPLDDELDALLAEERELMNEDGDGEEQEGGHKRRLDLASQAEAARSLAGAAGRPEQPARCTACLLVPAGSRRPDGTPRSSRPRRRAARQRCQAAARGGSGRKAAARAGSGGS